ncbi:peptidase S8/S53 domain-containing protein [Plectosphaerella cucumerina]|uniref:Peptidase S8/S53 domain-containing protein n=1 Tax=Plectosphaerella cucumerina TaxID=40658 RepID=A0A8K0X3K8_9PEZI|nr:peptidase S8/S53 domain-containing protein [Plectosphaerella cucumerina]
MRLCWAAECLLLGCLSVANGQQVQCSSLADGCTGGRTHDASLRDAIARFQPHMVYGGRGDSIVFSSAERDSTLSQISLSCRDGSIPPPIIGSTAQTLLETIRSCPNQCGSIAIGGGDNCGFGVLIANDATSMPCFIKAVDVMPSGTSPTVKPTSGPFISIGCYTDRWDARTLTAGSANEPGMTVDRCMQLAQGYRYAGVEYSTECFWGNEVTGSASMATGQCDMPCDGQPFELCGGGNLINVYQNRDVEMPKPTIVPSAGSFGSPACLVDSADGRILRNGSTEAWGESGMTVEKCADLARTWRYAGVEYSGECFWGDDIFSVGDAVLQDCNMPCAGNQLEACGAGNRMLVYTDASWEDKSRLELADAMEVYYALVAELYALVKRWDDLIAEYEASQGGNQNAKRAIEQRSPALLALIRQVRLDIGALSSRIESYNNRIDYLFKIAHRRNKVDDVEMGLQTRVNNEVNEQMANLLGTVASDLVFGAARVVRLAILAIGVPEVQVGGILVGIFFSARALIKSLRGIIDEPNPGQTQPTQQQTPTPTTWSTTSTMSTICTATATTTPIIILTKQNVNRAQFDGLVESLPKSDENLIVAEPWMDHWIYIATLDECTSMELTDNPLVEAWSIDAPLEFDDAEAAPSDLQKRAHAAADPARNVEENDDHDGVDVSSGAPNSAGILALEQLFNATVLEKRGPPGPNSQFKLQENSPGHLGWISPLARYDSRLMDRGYYYDFGSEYLFDGSTQRASPPPLVYVVDSGFLNLHQGLGAVFDSFGVSPDGRSRAPQDPPPNSHGTCMASLATGRYHSAAKNTRLVTVQLDSIGNVRSYARRAVFALNHIMRHAAANAGTTNAVISMSWGVEKPYLYWPSERNPPPRGTQRANVFQILMPLVWSKGIVALASAGNDHRSGDINNDVYQIDYKLPRGVGGTDTPLIVVGNNQFDNTRYPTSQFLDRTSKGVLTVYNVGTNVDCAVRGRHPNGEYIDVNQDNLTTYGVEPPGTSQATAITAGMVAYWLGDPVLHAQFMVNGVSGFAREVKRHLVNTAIKFKWNTAVAIGDGIPRAALGEYVLCPRDATTVAGLPAVSPPFIPSLNTRRVLTYTDVTEGTTMVLNPLPQCHLI